MVLSRSDQASNKVINTVADNLLQRHLEGNPEAFSQLLSHYRAPVYSYLVRCGLDRFTCDDLFQEVFFTIHRCAAQYDVSRPLKPWVFTIVVNTVRSHLRKVRIREVATNNNNLVTAPPAVNSPHDQLCLNETLKWLENQLLLLPETQRECILLCCCCQIDQKEAAVILEIPLNTLKTNLRRARLSLARALEVHHSNEMKEVST